MALRCGDEGAEQRGEEQPALQAHKVLVRIGEAMSEGVVGMRPRRPVLDVLQLLTGLPPKLTPSLLSESPTTPSMPSSSSPPPLHCPPVRARAPRWCTPPNLGFFLGEADDFACLGEVLGLVLRKAVAAAGLPTTLCFLPESSGNLLTSNASPVPSSWKKCIPKVKTHDPSSSNCAILDTFAPGQERALVPLGAAALLRFPGTDGEALQGVLPAAEPFVSTPTILPPRDALDEIGVAGCVFFVSDGVVLLLDDMFPLPFGGVSIGKLSPFRWGVALGADSAACLRFGERATDASVTSPGSAYLRLRGIDLPCLT